MANINQYDFEWVRLAEYCKRTGETAYAIYKRRARGIWQEGRHIQMRHGGLWVNLPEVKKWIEHGMASRYRKGSKS